MNQQLYIEFINEYTLEALEICGDSITQAADYLERKPKPGLFSKNRQEKRAALERVKKVFSSSRGRSAYIVLKSLGLDNLAKEKL